MNQFFEWFNEADALKSNEPSPYFFMVFEDSKITCGD